MPCSMRTATWLWPIFESYAEAQRRAQKLYLIRKSGTGCRWSIPPAQAALPQTVRSGSTQGTSGMHLLCPLFKTSAPEH